MTICVGSPALSERTPPVALITRGIAGGNLLRSARFRSFRLPSEGRGREFESRRVHQPRHCWRLPARRRQTRRPARKKSPAQGGADRPCELVERGGFLERNPIRLNRTAL